MAGEFDVTLELSVKVKKKGEGKDSDWYSQNTNIKYEGMDYLQIAATNGAIVKFGEILAELGWDGAKLKGYPAELVDAAKASIDK